jgi:hypothetical protein
MTLSVRALVLSAAAAFVALPAGAQSSDVSGRWEVQLNTSDEAHKATLTLKKEGEKVTGTIRNEQQAFEVTGTQKGAEVSLAFDYPAESITIRLNGTQQGDSISGAATFGDDRGTWTAKRMPAADTPPPSQAGAGAVDITGTWVFELQSAAGTFSPTVTFKQSGETLTGRYVGQLGEAPIQGTLKGGQLSFGFEAVVQDMKLQVRYAGVATNESLKGTATFGDMGEGQFTARRK